MRFTTSVRFGAIQAVVASFILVIGSVAWAQERGDRGRDRGRSGRGDWQQRMLERYPESDANKDGQISPEEMRAFWSQRRQNFGQVQRNEGRDRDPDRGRRGGRGGPWGMMQRPEEILREHPEADKNGDGRLDRDEMRSYFEANSREMFRRHLQERHPEADTNKDGQISDDELQASRSRFETRRTEEILRRHPEADTDKDGKLSEQEMQALRQQEVERFRARLLERHPEADTNKDGQLSEEELGALREQFRQRFRDGQGSSGADAASGAGPATSGDRRGRPDRGPRELGRTDRDPWAQYVERFCAEYRLDAAQRATAQSILKDCNERKAKLQQTATGDSARAAENRKAVDDLFKELQRRLQQIPTTDQKNAVKTGQGAASKPA